ncbi:ribosomal protein S8-like protein [Podospora aff. communis PSN243]|uniref:Small ribosomal subunit protein uS8m n=1 Tax=Podospora aff. communis PSN243 TaxID=3040156 RepID=A0AAV9GHM1_9PEZI|nr:ribosomal protein S8-like protein [Podospora aff. communis PSN243]
MGIYSITNMCAHLQNATRARLGITSLPNTKYNLHLALALQRTGFIGAVTRGGAHPPAPEEFQTLEPEPVTTANAATRRLWVQLKYFNNEPVLRNLKAVSKPSRRVTADLNALGRVARGFQAGMHQGLNLGECLFLSTDRGVLEAREALEKKVGGMVLCRVS